MKRTFSEKLSAPVSADRQRVLTSEAIDFIRFPLAVMVVVIHSYHGDVPDLSTLDFGALSGTDIYDIVRVCLSHVLSSIAVPTFFVISGYLFFKRLEDWDWQVWRSKMKSRFRTLFIPYIIWCTLTIVLKVGRMVIQGKPASGIIDWLNEQGWLHMFWDSNTWGEGRINFFGYIAPHHTSPTLGTMWFIRDLMVLIILTPLIYWLIKRCKFSIVVLLGILYLTRIWPDIHALNYDSPFYFSLGAYFSIWRKDLMTSLQRVRIPSYILAMVFFVVSTYLNGHEERIIYRAFFILPGIIAALNISYYLVTERGLRKNAFLTESCFFIFAFHMLILGYCFKLLEKIIVWENAPALILRYLLEPTLAISICLLTFWLMRKWLPKLTSVLTGGRG